jgi:hypothetical protein
MRTTYITIGVISLFTLATVVYGFFIAGSPSEARGAQFDQDRVSDLQSLSYSVDNYYSLNKKLPKTLTDLSASKYSYSSENLKDPETGKSYEYKSTGTTSYQLCATFSTDSTNPDKRNPYGYENEKFKHPKGHHCFDLKVTSSVSTTKNSNIKSTEIADERIDEVTTDNDSANTGNFPYGFFSTNSSEWGMVIYSTTPVSITINFKEPEKIESISNTFSSCSSGTDCYIWSAKGVANGKTVDLVTDAAAGKSNTASKQTINSSEKFSSIILTAERTEGTKYIYWKKISLTYKS